MLTEMSYYFCTDSQVRFVSVILRDFIFFGDAILDANSPDGIIVIDNGYNFEKENVLKMMKGSLAISKEEALKILSVN